MKLAPLTIIPAGAGSGKTHTLQQRLADGVVSGTVAPDRILAATFTEAAAAELKGRIRFELVRRGRIEDALRLEQSYISTIHGFGLQVLTEFAFDAGISPAPRLLDAAEQDLLVRKALSAIDKADPISRDLTRFGYRFDPVTGESAEDLFRGTLRGLIDRLRTLGPRAADPALITRAGQRIRDIYGPTDEADVLEKALLGSVQALLKAHPGSLEALFTENKTATGTFADDYRNLRRADRGHPLTKDWGLWCSLQSLRISMRGTPTPAGYDACAEAVMNAARALHRHPGPLADALKHAESLLGAAQDILGRYAEGKKLDRLVDFSDMVTDAWKLLADFPDVLRHLKGRLDCLVIDEFQDTNPIQFSLLWLLHAAGVPALVVGDLKQAIMGFQNADPRLFEALQARNPQRCDPLTQNWRSSAPLLAWINAVSRELFGEGCTDLEPKAAFESVLSPLEVIEAPKFIWANRVRASWTASRIRQLLDDPAQAVWDKPTRSRRRLKGGDVALLCPTHKLVDTYAESLRAQGIRTRVEQPGWLASPAVQLACQALAWVADPEDRHAALYLAVTELGEFRLSEALAAMLEGGLPDSPLLARMAALRDGCATLTPETVLGRLIETLDLYGAVSTWPDATQHRANLLRLQAEAAAFRDANRQILIAGGYYGSGVKTFLAWLAARAEADDARPQPRVVDEDAVVVTTWHAAKGLEWPVVAVCGVHREVGPRFPHVAVDWESLDDFSDLLSRGGVNFTPLFHADETNDRFRPPLQASAEEEARRLLYVALTRAREKVILEWPSHLEKSRSEKVTLWSLLHSGGRIRLGKDSLSVGETVFPCTVSEAKTTEASPETWGDGGEIPYPLPVLGRRAIRPGEVPAGLSPESVAPSALPQVAILPMPGDLKHERFGSPLEVDLDVKGVDRGLLLHKCFELMVEGGANEEGREVDEGSGGGDAADRLARAFGPALDEPRREAILAAGRRFHDWLGRRFSLLRRMPEVPVLGLDANGSVVSGVIDLLLETADGYWVLDHKSDQFLNLKSVPFLNEKPNSSQSPRPTPAAEIVDRFASYLPQLCCYTDLLRRARPEKPVLGVAIHWISRGEATLRPF